MREFVQSRDRGLEVGLSSDGKDHACRMEVGHPKSKVRGWDGVEE